MVDLEIENKRLKYIIKNITDGDKDLWLSFYNSILSSGFGANTGACKADAALKQFRKRYK